MRKACANENNSSALRFAQQVSGTIVVFATLFCIAQFLYVMAQGFYNTFTTVGIVFIIVTYFILQILQAIIVSKVNLDFTLATKVHADGHLLVVGINKRGREIFKLYMNEIDDQLEDNNSLMAD